MNRKDREITDKNEIARMLGRFSVCRLAVTDQPAPYIVPLNYGLRQTEEGFTLYFHSAKRGMKLDLMRKNPVVSFEMDGGHQLVAGGKACEYGYNYESLIGRGVISFLESPEEKAEGLTYLMRHIAPEKEFRFTARETDAVAVFILRVTEITAKKCSR